MVRKDRETRIFEKKLMASRGPCVLFLESKISERGYRKSLLRIGFSMPDMTEKVEFDKGLKEDIYG